MALRWSILQSMLLCISTMALAANFDHYELGQYYFPDQVTAPQVQRVTPAVIDFNGSSGSPVIDTQGQVLAVHWGWDSDRDYHGRLTGIPVSHLVARMPLVAAAADCPDPLATLQVQATVLESGAKTDRVRLTIHDEGACLSHVDRVVWHLHATFDEPDAEGWPGAPDFPVTIVAWGMFDLTATVHMGARVIELPGSAQW